MGVTYELIDAPYPYVCAVYRCRCGATAVRYAGDAATPPPEWHREPCDDGDLVICPACLDLRAAAAQQA